MVCIIGNGIPDWRDVEKHTERVVVVCYCVLYLRYASVPWRFFAVEFAVGWK